MRRRNGRVVLVALGLALLGGGLLATGVVARGVLLDPSPIVFESLESRTHRGEPIYNRIAFVPGPKKDVWLMQQSDRGLTPGFHKWDRLMIEVDRTRSPAVARFVQLAPGEMKAGGGHGARPFRVTCFMCHANGPRAIRPNLASTSAGLSWKDRITLWAWNRRINSYGRVVADRSHGGPSGVPFRNPDAFGNERLEVAACARCHNDSEGGRGHLVRQNAPAIRFMIEHEFMPPRGVALSEGERDALGRFVDGRPALGPLASEGPPGRRN